MAAKSLGEKHVELAEPLSMEQVNALHTAQACCERMERLRVAMNTALLDAGVGIGGLAFTSRWAEIEAMLTAHRFVMQKRLAQLRHRQEVAA